MVTAEWTEPQLVEHLQDAVQLELFTIPLYLCALYSVTPAAQETNAVYQLLQDTVNEEMLHLELACNVLNALGGSPVLTGSAAPSYPSDIPFIDPPLSLDLGPATLRQILLFMEIELPSYDDPGGQIEPLPDYQTIGAFYDAVESGLNQVNQFPGDPSRQVSGIFGTEDTPVTDLQSALTALELIVSQGEGTSTDPYDSGGVLAHYYRFLQIAENPQWVAGQTDNQPNLFNMIHGPSGLTYSPPQHELLAFFDGCYSYLLERLQAAFNGNPSDVPNCVGVMFNVIDPTMKYVISQTYDQPNTPQYGQNLTPCFRYAVVNYPDMSVLEGLYQALEGNDRSQLAAVAQALGLTSSP